MKKLKELAIQLLGTITQASVSGRAAYNRQLRIIGEMHLYVMITSFSDDEQKEAYALLDQVSDQLNRGQKFRLQKVIDCVAMDLGK